MDYQKINISELEQFPNEILIKILDDLPNESLLNVMKASKSIRNRFYYEFKDKISAAYKEEKRERMELFLDRVREQLKLLRNSSYRRKNMNKLNQYKSLNIINIDR